MDAGALAELFAAPWAQGLEWLGLLDCKGSATSAQAEAWTAPFTRLTRLLFDAPPFDGAGRGASAAAADDGADAGASLLAPLLSAPWAAGLRSLSLGGSAGTASALAAAPLLSLRSLDLRSVAARMTSRACHPRRGCGTSRP